MKSDASQDGVITRALDECTPGEFELLLALLAMANGGLGRVSKLGETQTKQTELAQSNQHQRPEQHFCRADEATV